MKEMIEEVEETEDIDDEKDFEEVAGEPDGIADDAQVATKPIRLSPEILLRDKRTSAIVEVNLKDGSARVVDKSTAPKLTQKVLKEKGAPIQDAEIVFDGEVLLVGYWHGINMALEMARAQLIDTYAGQDMTDVATLTSRDTAIKQLLLAGMIADPIFSYQGEPEGAHPIEDISPILTDGLWAGHLNIDYPIEDDIYQVKVLRGVPLETSILIGKTFETFPVGGKKVNVDEMSDEDREMFIKRTDAQRSVTVASMLLDPQLSCDGEGVGTQKHPVPVENLSEKMMQCLHNAYKASNVPEVGMIALNRFLRKNRNRKRKNAGR